MQNHIILLSIKCSKIFVQCSSVYWVDFGECCIVFFGAKLIFKFLKTCISFTQKYFVNVNNFHHLQTFKLLRLLVVESEKDGLQIHVKISLGN